MKVRRFYDKTYQHPASRYARYWKIDESFLWDTYQFFFGEGWSIKRIQAYFKRHNIQVKRHQLLEFIKASKKYNLIEEKRLKSTQKISETLYKSAINRGKKPLNFEESY